jgi:membrane protein
MAQRQSPKQPSGNILQRFVQWVDAFQQKHPVCSLPYAVVKKYGDDNAGHQAALITYYGFLSLFPLLIVATSVVDLIAQHNAHLRDQLLSGINTYFPIVGKQLQAGIHGNSKTGLALFIGVIVALYGARGIADAVRSVLDHAWAIPKVRRTGFPKSILKSLGILVGAGFGLLATTALTSFATAILNDAILVRLVPVVINIGLLYLIFMYVFTIGTSRRVARKSLRVGALTAAIGLLVLQAAGVVLIKHQLHNLQGLYGQFALVLAIMFWIYLQAQVFVYAIEINVVQAYRLWPRSLTGNPTTQADQNAYRMYAEAQAFRPKSEEAIEVTFKAAK